ncbi:hypothetical protein HPB49_003418 [Dermacentor silvarum]|uniref:Uncharacterized protein n=1 Tax=Dermacentor silvarum TaxID=543639 RepID=A0ACB8C733_DERSI|nr:hypothetical protein HPB49_003418 [Dermacentor silvarum]
MLSNAEETLTTDDKPATIGALSDRDAASVPITEQTNDSPPGEDMDEDTPPLAIDTDTIEDGAYNGACWKVVRNKRRARNAAAHETASLRQNASEHPSAEPKQSGPKRLPPLPLRDEKVIVRPLGGLRLDKWPRPTLATALWTAAGELSISQRCYPVSAYLAAPDDSCKGIVAGLDTRHPLTYAGRRDASIWNPDTTGSNDGAYVCHASSDFLGQSSAATHTVPASQSAKRASNWDTEPTTAPHQTSLFANTTTLQQSLGEKAIEDEQRQLKASTNADPPSATTPASGTSFKKAGRSRSKTPSRSRPKARVNSKSRSRSRYQSSSARNQVKRQTTSASEASPQPYKKALLNKLATSAATPDRQQARAPENTNAKAAPREVTRSPPNLHPTTRPPLLHYRTPTVILSPKSRGYALEAAIVGTNARIQAAIESARQESLALRQEIISVIHASEERTHALFAELRTPAGFQIRASPATPYRCKKIAAILTPGGFLF